jgi:hypothetical protein
MGPSEQTHLNSYLSNISPLSSTISSRFSWPKRLFSMKINWRIRMFFRRSASMVSSVLRILKSSNSPSACLHPRPTRPLRMSAAIWPLKTAMLRWMPLARSHTKRTRIITPISWLFKNKMKTISRITISKLLVESPTRRGGAWASSGTLVLAACRLILSSGKRTLCRFRRRLSRSSKSHFHLSNNRF